jgi:hypothetical protein
MTSLRLTRDDLRVIYTPGRGVTVYRKFSWSTVWTPRRLVPVAGER